MIIKIVHMRSSGLNVPNDQLFDLSCSSKLYMFIKKWNKESNGI